MKKKSRIVGNHIHRKYLVIGVLSSILLSIAIGFNLFSNQQLETKAHPTQSITLDAGTANEFVVSPDATKLVEPALIGNPDFEGYVQNQSIVSTFSKSNLESFSDPTGIGIESVLKSSDGNWIMSLVFRADWYNQNGEPPMFQKYLLKLKTNGTILKVYNVASGENNFTSSTNTNADGRYAVDGGALTIQDGKVSEWYYGYTPTSKKAQWRKVTLDENLNPLMYEDKSVPSNVPNSISFSLVKNYTTDNYWYLGNANVPFKQENSYGPIFRLFELDSGSFNNVLDLKFPLLSIINPSVTQITKGNVGFQISEILKTSDGGFIAKGYIFHENTDVSQINYSEHIIKFSSTGDFEWYKNLIGGNFKIQKDISTSEKLIVNKNTSESSTILQIDTITGDEIVLKTFPQGTNLTISESSKEGVYDFYGSVQKMEGDFSGYLNGPGAVIGTLDSSYSVKSANFQYSDQLIGIQDLILEDTTTNSYFMYGTTYSQIFSNTPQNGWQEHIDHVSKANLFFGEVDKHDDYSPAILTNFSISLDISDKDILNTSAINDLGWTVLDNWLITGSKNGSIADSNSLKVYDTDDLENSDIGLTDVKRVKWLYKRINANPLLSQTKINWKDLGFDQTKVGPQLVTYFVTDSQLQSTTTSRWVNKITDQTVEKDNYFFDVHNFAVPLSDVKSSLGTEALFKKLSKSMAWNGTTGQVDEDSAGVVSGDGMSVLSPKVSINPVQLQAVQDATVARPYPVDITYTPVEGTSITNRVWVFVTTKNTIVDETTNIVFYGNDYTIPWNIAKNQTEADVLHMGSIKIYDFKDSTHETDDSSLVDEEGNVLLPPLADEDNTEGLVLSNLSVVTTANITETTTVHPKFVYTDSRSTTPTETEGTIDVTIYSSVLLHVRQVVVNPNGNLIVPKNGYIEFENKGVDESITPDSFGKSVPSGAESENPNFSDVFTLSLKTAEFKNQLLANITIPEYYTYMGYVTSASEPSSTFSHASSQLTGTDKFSYIWSYESFEMWVSIYIQPRSVENPSMYSWDYARNDLGLLTNP